MESNSIFYPRQAGFLPGRSTLNQILFLSQAILDRFTKPRPGSRTILLNIDFSKAFDSARHPALFHKLISTCTILDAFCWPRQHQQVCHFFSILLLSDSRSVLATLSSPPSSFLPQSLWQIWQELSSLSSFSIRLQWVPRDLFLPGNHAADALARWEALLAPSAIPCSLSPLISRIHSFLFSGWRRTVSSKFFDTQVSSISTEELVLPRHARCVLSRLRCNGHSFLLGSYLSRIGRIENPSSSACGRSSQDTSHLILHCPATDSLRRSLFGDSLSLYDLWSRP